MNEADNMTIVNISAEHEENEAKSVFINSLANFVLFINMTKKCVYARRIHTNTHTHIMPYLVEHHQQAS